jgi:hypothetical protein
MQFFKIDHRNFSPWIWQFVNKEDYCLIEESRCSVCGKMQGRKPKNENYYDRPMEALLDKSGSNWTNIIGSGERPFFRVVSQRTLEIWGKEGIGTFPAFPITLLPPYPKKITEPPPMYYRLDYKKMEGVEIDLVASGFVDIKNCPECGFSFDVIKSLKLADWKIIPYVIKKDTWKGTNIFCDAQIGGMFCTEKVIDIAAKYKMTNFRFIPLEIAGSATTFRGVDYMAKDWRKKMAKQLEEFRKNFRPKDPETGQYIQ